MRVMKALYRPVATVEKLPSGEHCCSLDNDSRPQRRLDKTLNPKP